MFQSAGDISNQENIFCAYNCSHHCFPFVNNRLLISSLSIKQNEPSVEGIERGTEWKQLPSGKSVPFQQLTDVNRTQQLLPIVSHSHPSLVLCDCCNLSGHRIAFLCLSQTCTSSAMVISLMDFQSLKQCCLCVSVCVCVCVLVYTCLHATYLCVMHSCMHTHTHTHTHTNISLYIIILIFQSPHGIRRPKHLMRNVGMYTKLVLFQGRNDVSQCVHLFVGTH